MTKSIIMPELSAVTRHGCHSRHIKHESTPLFDTLFDHVDQHDSHGIHGEQCGSPHSDHSQAPAGGIIDECHLVTQVHFTPIHEHFDHELMTVPSPRHWGDLSQIDSIGDTSIGAYDVLHVNEELHGLAHPDCEQQICDLGLASDYKIDRPITPAAYNIGQDATLSLVFDCENDFSSSAGSPTTTRDASFTVSPLASTPASSISSRSSFCSFEPFEQSDLVLPYAPTLPSQGFETGDTSPNLPIVSEPRFRDHASIGAAFLRGTIAPRKSRPRNRTGVVNRARQSMSIKHISSANKKHRCNEPDCGAAFMRAEHLNRHMNKHMRHVVLQNPEQYPEETVFRCPACRYGSETERGAPKSGSRFDNFEDHLSKHVRGYVLRIRPVSGKVSKVSAMSPADLETLILTEGVLIQLGRHSSAPDPKKLLGQIRGRVWKEFGEDLLTMDRSAWDFPMFRHLSLVQVEYELKRKNFKAKSKKTLP